MPLTLVAPAAAPAVTAAELGDHLRLPIGFGDDPGTGGADDPALTRAITAAVASIERALATALLRQSWDWRTPDWPQAAKRGRAGRATLSPAPGAAALPLSPILSISSVSLIAPDGEITPWPAQNWRLDLSTPRPSLRARSGCLPQPPDGGHALIRFDAGYGDAASDIPADLRHAVLLLAAYYFETRADPAAETLSSAPHGLDHLLAPYRPLRLR